jgi:uncharacterized protein (DUF697 family)
MRPDGHGDRGGFSRLGRLRERARDWSQAHLRPLLREALWQDFDDTLRRLLRGDFADLSEGERRDRVEQVIGLSAMAAMAMAATPVPFLELPVQAAMVRAIARVHGHEKSGREVLWELGAALGGGIVLRQAFRLLPLVGPLPFLSRIYGATYALGRVAHVYYASEAAPQPEQLKQLFERTARSETLAESRRLDRDDVESTLRFLDELRARAVISEGEYRRKRDEVLAAI